MSSNEKADNPASLQPMMSNSPPPTVNGHTRGSRRWLIASAAVALAAVAGGVGVDRAAGADDGPASPETAEQAAWQAVEGDLWRRQALLDDLKSWILARPGIDASGYIESVNDPEAGSTILLWKGPANSLQRQIKDKAHQMGIPVTVAQRKYGRNDIDRAAKRFSGRSGQGAFKNFKITGIGGISADFDGLTVSGEYINPLTVSRAEADGALAKAATAETGIATAIESGVQIILA